MSDLDEALSNVDAFEAEDFQGVSFQLDRGSVLQCLRALLKRPDLFHQRALNACGRQFSLHQLEPLDLVASGRRRIP